MIYNLDIQYIVFYVEHSDIVMLWYSAWVYVRQDT